MRRKRVKKVDPTNDNPATDWRPSAGGDALSDQEPPAEPAEPGDPRTRTYMLPAPVAIAMSTGRTQFIGGLIRKVREGAAIEPAQVIGMLELIRDWTDAKQADDRRNTTIRGNLAATMTSLRELRTQVGTLLGQVSGTVTAAHRIAHRHGCGEPLGPDDED